MASRPAVVKVETLVDKLAITDACAGRYTGRYTNRDRDADAWRDTG